MQRILQSADEECGVVKPFLPAAVRLGDNPWLGVAFDSVGVGVKSEAGDQIVGGAWIVIGIDPNLSEFEAPREEVVGFGCSISGGGCASISHIYHLDAVSARAGRESDPAGFEALLGALAVAKGP